MRTWLGSPTTFVVCLILFVFVSLVRLVLPEANA
jgi:hypothetical protein